MEEEGLENPGKYISGSIKPDLILTDQESGETMVLDVKYKDYRNGVLGMTDFNFWHTV